MVTAVKPKQEEGTPDVARRLLESLEEENTRPTKRARAMVIGSGGREHALVWKLQQELGENVLFVPGNAGVPDRQRRNVSANDFDGLYRMAKAERVDLTVVGSEQPLVNGFVDYVFERDKRFPVFGPNQRAAHIEGSKSFAKRLMVSKGIPTSEPFYIVDSAEDALKRGMEFLRNDGVGVIKADGLAAGKGSIVYKSEAELTSAIQYLKSFGQQMVLEKFLRGEEVSYIVFTDGYDILSLLPTQDHKAAYDGDNGPNTGGMGAYTRPKIVIPQLEAKIRDIMLKTVRGMVDEGRTFKGVLYAGLMIVDGEPYVLEFNSRFGDPETQPVMALMGSSLVDVLYASMEGGLNRQSIRWKPGEALTVVLATQGYPEDYSQHTGRVIRGLNHSHPNTVVYHAGTERGDGMIINSGGRVLNVTGYGPDIRKAKDNAYNAIGSDAIHFDGMHFRHDIGYRSLR